MNNELPELEYGVPLAPTVKQGKETSKTVLLRTMKPGSSFQLPWEERKPWASAASKMKGEFTCRRQANGNHRLWRLVPDFNRAEILRSLAIGEKTETRGKSSTDWHGTATSIGIKISVKGSTLTRIA